MLMRKKLLMPPCAVGFRDDRYYVNPLCVMKQRSFLIHRLPVVLLVLQASSLNAQLPPEGTAPKSTALPASQPATRVVSLPAPPTVSTNGVATPAFVPLAAAPAAKPTDSPQNLPPNSSGLQLDLPIPDTQIPPGTANGSSTPPSIQLPPIPSVNQLPLPAVSTAPIAEPPSIADASPPELGTVAVAEAGLAESDEAAQFHAGELVAVVGNEHILVGDMAVFVDPIIEQNRSRIPSPEDERKIRNQLTRQALRQYVEVKAMYQEFFRDMVGTAPPEELEEMRNKITSRAGKIFFEKQVRTMMNNNNVNSLRELEEKLAEKSLSLVVVKRQFVEQVLSSELERKYVPDKFEFDREELLKAYHAPEYQEKWNVPGRARWRQLTIRFDKHETRESVDQLIRNLGNQIYLGGKPFEAVAKQSSEGYTAEEGGIYDWTNQGSLKSKEIDAALFQLPLNRLSQVIEDDIGLHIIEVLEREEGHTKDFTEAQGELREMLSEKKRDEEIRKFRKKVMDRTPVWTLWPQDIEGSRPLSDALGNVGS
jgi:DNA-binding MarR family transcriptional regulator